MSMKREQKCLYALLTQESRCFVRMAQADDALWVSDLPKRHTAWQSVIPALLEEGFCYWENAQTGLLNVDFSQDGWLAYLQMLPTRLPFIPPQDVYHPLYALLRLWMLHPSTPTDETRCTLRRVMKLTQGDEDVLLRTVPALLAETATRLRQGLPVAYDAGRVLAEWLSNREGME